MNRKRQKTVEIPKLKGRLYVVGDLHGVLKETESLLNHLVKKENLTKDDQVVFVGDYIDRGYESSELITLLLDLKKDYSKTRFLKGNHEDMFLDYMGFGGNYGENFIMNGGGQTLISYSFKPTDNVDDIFVNFPPEHFEFFQKLERYILFHEFLIVHAGINPLKTLTDQLDEELYWIRDEFIMTQHHLPQTVVFGHTPFKTIFNDYPSKIGIDTGLVYGNVLSCVELTEFKVFQVKSGKKKVSTFDLEIGDQDE